MSKQLTSVQDAIQFIQSGDVRVMFRSQETHNEYQYRVQENRNGKAFYVYLIAKSGNHAYMGSIVNGYFKRTDKSRVSVKAPAFVAFAWVWAQLDSNNMPHKVEMVGLGQ